MREPKKIIICVEEKHMTKREKRPTGAYVEMNFRIRTKTKKKKSCSAEKCYVWRINLVFSACRCMPKNKGNAINRSNKLQKNFT